MHVIKDPSFRLNLPTSSDLKHYSLLLSMSCISLRLRLPPARKAWKSLTSTLGKLHKIHSSKTMKKSRKHTTKTTTRTATTMATPKFLATKRFRRKKLAIVKSFICKKPKPVYIDKLFKEPSCDLVEHLKPQIAHKSRTEKIARLPYESSEGGAGTSKEGRSSTSDDMWESVALASPLMHGIDERAEEFIARFREEMAAQEMLARNL